MSSMMLPIHVRMARAALNWTLRDLAKRAQVNLNTVARYEDGKEVLSGTIQRLEKVFAAEGVSFIHEDAIGGVGIRLAQGLAPQRARVKKNREAGSRDPKKRKPKRP